MMEVELAKFNNFFLEFQALKVNTLKRRYFCRFSVSKKISARRIIEVVQLARSDSGFRANKFVELS
jgi:hypothetical protein